MIKYKIGYTTGVYDLFHVGHLNIFARAKDYCDVLIVGVTTDEVASRSKGRTPIIPFKERCKIVEAIKYVDKVIPQDSYEIEAKIEAVKKYKVNVIFVGSDWYGTEKWVKLENELSKINCNVIYLPHTDGVSSSLLRSKIK